MQIIRGMYCRLLTYVRLTYSASPPSQVLMFSKLLFLKQLTLKNAGLLIAGAKESDYAELKGNEEEEIVKVDFINGESDLDREKTNELTDTDLNIGKITFVSCATGSEGLPLIEDAEEADEVNCGSPKEFG